MEDLASEFDWCVSSRSRMCRILLVFTCLAVVVAVGMFIFTFIGLEPDSLREGAYESIVKGVSWCFTAVAAPAAVEWYRRYRPLADLRAIQGRLRDLSGQASTKRHKQEISRLVELGRGFCTLK